MGFEGFLFTKHASFPDTETAENLAQQLIRGQMPGDFPKRILGRPQVFRQQFAGAVTFQLGLALQLSLIHI
mgnify:CR=1 FL=1